MPAKPYFEGWYFKNQTAENTICLIPGFITDENKNRRAFIQILTDTSSHFLEFDGALMKFQREPLRIRIGDNYFSEKGIRLNISDHRITLKGTLKFGLLNPLAKNIMGPFAHIHNMECSHGIISMYHSLSGSLMLDGEEISFHGGNGYAETDRGSAFPTKYTWTHCNRFSSEPEFTPIGRPYCSVVAASARIPFGPISFRGTICAVLFKGHEYILATYYGARVKKAGPDGFEIIQGRYRLKFTLLEGTAHPLMAPTGGKMQGIVHEHAKSRGTYEFYDREHLMFYLTTDWASFEHYSKK